MGRCGGAWVPVRSCPASLSDHGSKARGGYDYALVGYRLGASVWTIPADTAKNGRVHEVPLSELALDILQAIPRFVGSDLVFTTTGVTPISGFTRVKDRLDLAMGVSNWRFHDLRRTAASGMARLGVAPHVIEKVLNHVSGQISGVAAVYNRHGYDAEKRNALELWARHLLSETVIAKDWRYAIAAGNDRPGRGTGSCVATHVAASHRAAQST